MILNVVVLFSHVMDLNEKCYSNKLALPCLVSVQAHKFKDYERLKATELEPKFEHLKLYLQIRHKGILDFVYYQRNVYDYSELSDKSVIPVMD